MGRPKQVLSRAAIEHLIAEGQTIVIFEGQALRLDCWLDRHPGGKLAVQHMVGRDATNEMEIYHSPATLQVAHRYVVGRVEEPWVNFTPPIRGGVFRKAPHLSDASGASEAEQILSSLPGTAQTTGTDNGGSPPTLRVNRSLDPDSSPLARVRSNVSTHSDTTASTVDDTFSSAESVDTQTSQESTEDFITRAMQGYIDSDIKAHPSLDADTQSEINRKYHDLHARVIREGFYDCPYIEYGKECIRYFTLFGLFLYALRSEWYLTSAAFLGLCWHQIMFVAHDAGHRGITHHFVTDTLIGMFVADFACGMSIGWWKSSHNVHHLITNHPEHDPDIQNVPLFATCPSFFKSIRSSYYDFTFVWDAFANIAVKYQVYTYYPVMAIARFNLYLLSILHLISDRAKGKGMTAWIRPTEIAFIMCYWVWFGYGVLWCSIPTWPLRVAFVLISHIITVPLHIQITLSHWGMPTADLGEGESFPQRQLRTTMDVDCPAWMDFVHGGLQFQAIHHLFPRVPRHNLRRLQVLVREFCKDTGIPYNILGFVDGNRKVLGRLDEISHHVNLLVECQKYMAATGESGLH